MDDNIYRAIVYVHIVAAIAWAWGAQANHHGASSGGRRGVLIAAGAGFHPQLTGRENIYLNAAILGMSENETKRKFDEMVDFASIGKFLETPVGRYSSGMSARLGFAVKEPRRRYTYRLRCGFNDVADAEYEQLWVAPSLTWARLEEISERLAAADPRPATKKKALRNPSLRTS